MKRARIVYNNKISYGKRLITPITYLCKTIEYRKWIIKNVLKYKTYVMQKDNGKHSVII